MSIKYVILFPVTKENRNSKALFSLLYEMVNNKDLDRLIILDKSSSGYFSKFCFSLPTTPQIECRRIESQESLFDTLKRVEIHENEWVAQVHDDDSISGNLNHDQSENVLICMAPKIRIRTRFKVRELLLDELRGWPMSSLFSFIPWYFWNEFASYLREQQSPSSATSDVAFQYASRNILDFTEMSSYVYTYNNHNWSTARSRRRNIRKIMNFEGYAETVPLMLFHILQLVECLVLVLWISQNTNYVVNQDLKKTTFNRIRLSRRSYIAANLSAMIQHLTLAFLSIGRINPQLENRYSLIERRLKLSSIIRKVHKCKNSRNLERLLRQLINQGELAQIKRRLDFFCLQLSREEDIVRN